MPSTAAPRPKNDQINRAVTVTAPDRTVGDGAGVAGWRWHRRAGALVTHLQVTGLSSSWNSEGKGAGEPGGYLGPAVFSVFSWLLLMASW